jgi:alpha,alpha-trehalase
MSQGLLDAEHRDLAIGMLDDLLALVKRYKVIPNASRTYLMGRSQPPFLTSYIFDMYETFHLSGEWLQDAMKLAEIEYQTVWQGAKKPNYRLVYRGLSRYYDINLLHDLAETESGWDMTPRFYRHTLNFLPVDLNALLYKYETDFAKAARLRHDQKAAVAWFGKAEQRVRVMNELMWDRVRGLYFDYDYTHNRRSHVASLAAYVPMWAGMVTEQQAAVLVGALRLFEHRGGLAATDALLVRDRIHDSVPMQWAYPNGWAPLHFIVIQALERYGYHKDAERIALKWLNTNLKWFNAHGEFIEKYNVVHPQKPPAEGAYPSQIGFGWTNAIFERLCRDYLDKPAAN